MPIENVVLPILGTGNQGLNEVNVIPLLLAISEKFLNELDNLQTITFIEKDLKKAKFLSEGINKALGRLEINLDSVTFSKNIKKEISRKLKYVHEHLLPGNLLCIESREVIENNESLYYQIGILGRRMLELIMIDIFSGEQHALYTLIIMAKDAGVPDWIVSYMHLIRQFVNTSAHYNSDYLTLKSVFNEKDLMINLLAIDKVLGFWIENREVLLKRVSGFGKNKLVVHSVV